MNAIMKRWLAIGLALMALACWAPFSSSRPDAVQRLIGLSGGTGSVGKALTGIVVVALAVVLIASLLKRFSKKL